MYSLVICLDNFVKLINVFMKFHVAKWSIRESRPLNPTTYTVFASTNRLLHNTSNLPCQKYNFKTEVETWLAILLGLLLVWKTNIILCVLYHDLKWIIISDSHLRPNPSVKIFKTLHYVIIQFCVLLLK